MQYISFRNPCLAALILLFSFNAFSQQNTDSLTIKIDKLFKEYNRSNGPGCAVGIIRNGSVVFTKGYGMANLEYDIPITPSTIFDIASVSKQFTGLAISTLIQEGKIALDDDIRKYLPEAPKFNKTITIRHLAHHISGIRDWPQTLNAAGWRWDEVFSFDDIMRMVKYQKDLDFEPGERYSYCNTGYNLLAAIVEKVTGMSFRMWTDANIFTPLQMRSSHFQDDYTRIVKNLAYSYSFKNNEFVKSPGALTAYGSSSLFTTVDDLAKWTLNFNKQIAAQNPVYIRMLTEGKTNDGETVHYGYGLMTGEDRGIKTISHNGSWAGYRTIIANYPAEKLSVIILSNASDFNVGKYSQEIADLFLSGKFKTKIQLADNIKELPTIKIDSLFAKKYVGAYQLEPGRAVTATWENSHLMIQTNSENKFPAEFKSDSTIWIQANESSMTFVKDKNGNVNLLKFRDLQAKRITPWVPNAAELNLYAGIYYSVELAAEYKVTVVGKKITMRHMRIGDFNLIPDPTTPNQFIGAIGRIRFIKNARKKTTGFMLSGSRVTDIWFEKH